MTLRQKLALSYLGIAVRRRCKKLAPNDHTPDEAATLEDQSGIPFLVFRCFQDIWCGPCGGKIRSVRGDLDQLVSEKLSGWWYTYPSEK